MVGTTIKEASDNMPRITKAIAAAFSVDASQVKILEVISIITKGCLGSAFIIDQHNDLIGIITDGDLRRALENKIDLNEKVLKIMNVSPITISQDHKLITALEIMQEEKVMVLPVTQKGKILGAIQLINCK